MADQLDPTKLTAVMTTMGFAIQRGLQIVDPFIDAGVAWYLDKHKKGATDEQKKAFTGNAKRMVTTALSCLFGVLMKMVLWPKGVLSVYGLDVVSWADTALTALLLSAGAEGANSVLKGLEGLKQTLKKQAPTTS